MKRDFGRILYCLPGLVCVREEGSLCGGKHGLVGLTKTIALKSLQNVPVMRSAGFVLTPLVDHQVRTHAEKTGLHYDEAGVAMVSEKHPQASF